MNHDDAWPELPYTAWADTARTLHMWTQVVGKLRLAYAPWWNHSWHVVLYPTVRGLTTSPIHDGERCFQVDFDFLRHRLVVESGEGDLREQVLEPRSVADFHAGVMGDLAALGFRPRFHPVPNEVPDAIPFAEDVANASYDAEPVGRFWRVLRSTHRVFERYRSGFLGKQSPIHFFWGSFDLALTRFSGREAPRHPGGFPNLPDEVTQEAYSHEVASAGFWPGGGPVDEATFYAYAYPLPEGYGEREVRPAAARFDAQAGEWFLPYEAVRTATDPDATLLEFLETTYAAAADSAGWDRAALDCEIGRPRRPRPVA